MKIRSLIAVIVVLFLEIHLSFAKPKKVCPVKTCKLEFDFTKTLNKHINEKHLDLKAVPGYATCIICHQKFEPKHAYAIHRAEMHKLSFGPHTSHKVHCPVCKDVNHQEFSSLHALAAHLRKKHPKMMGALWKMHVDHCSECKNNFINPDQYDQVEIEETGNAMSPSLIAEPESNSLLSQSNSKSIPCVEPECAHRFKTEKEQIRHAEEKHPGIEIPHYAWCVDCKKYLVTGENFLLHNNKFHQRKVPTNHRIECSFCKESLKSQVKQGRAKKTEFEALKAFLKHLKTEHKSIARGLFSDHITNCPACAEARIKVEEYEWKYSPIEDERMGVLDNEVEVLANKNETRNVQTLKKFSCTAEGCKTSFKDLIYLKNHCKKFHPGALVPGYVWCADCKTYFQEGVESRNHQQKVHGAEDRHQEIACPFGTCLASKENRRPSTLKKFAKHLKVYHPNDAKRILKEHLASCPICVSDGVKADEFGLEKSDGSEGEEILLRKAEVEIEAEGEAGDNSFQEAGANSIALAPQDKNMLLLVDEIASAPRSRLMGNLGECDSPFLQFYRGDSSNLLKGGSPDFYGLNFDFSRKSPIKLNFFPDQEQEEEASWAKKKQRKKSVNSSEGRPDDPFYSLYNFDLDGFDIGNLRLDFEEK